MHHLIVLALGGWNPRAYLVSLVLSNKYYCDADLID
jgi:hypothetical protein